MHTVTPSSSLEPSISLASVPCGFSSIALGCCLSTLLHVKTVLYLFIEIISQTVEKFAKFKTHKNLVLYMGIVSCSLASFYDYSIMHIHTTQHTQRFFHHQLWPGELQWVWLDTWWVQGHLIHRIVSWQLSFHAWRWASLQEHTNDACNTSKKPQQGDY